MLTDKERQEIATEMGVESYSWVNAYAEKIERAVLAKVVQQKPIGGNTGHGHVWERPDGMKARCGGPSLCHECARDKAHPPQSAIPPEWREAVQEFVDRVERGEVRSKRTYEKFKQLLGSK